MFTLSSVNFLLIQRSLLLHTVLPLLLLLNGGVAVVHASSLNDSFIHPSAGAVSVYFTVYASSSEVGRMVLRGISSSPRNRYTFPSTLINPSSDWSAPVQCRVDEELSVSVKDQ